MGKRREFSASPKVTVHCVGLTLELSLLGRSSRMSTPRMVTQWLRDAPGGCEFPGMRESEISPWQRLWHWRTQGAAPQEHCLIPQPRPGRSSLGKASHPRSANQVPLLGTWSRSAGWSPGSGQQPYSRIGASGTVVRLSDSLAPVEYCSKACRSSHGRTQRMGVFSSPCSWGQACDSGCTSQENLHEASTQ